MCPCISRVACKEQLRNRYADKNSRLDCSSPAAPVSDSKRHDFQPHSCRVVSLFTKQVRSQAMLDQTTTLLQHYAPR